MKPDTSSLTMYSTHSMLGQSTFYLFLEKRSISLLFQTIFDVVWVSKKDAYFNVHFFPFESSWSIIKLGKILLNNFFFKSFSWATLKSHSIHFMNTPNFYYLVASSSSCENDGSEGSYFGPKLHHTRHFPTSYSAVRAGSNFEVFSSSSVNLCLHFHLPNWIIFKKYFTFTKTSE